MVVPGKMRRRGKYSGYRSDWKKAYVTLREGEKMIEYADTLRARYRGRTVITDNNMDGEFGITLVAVSHVLITRNQMIGGWNAVQVSGACHGITITHNTIEDKTRGGVLLFTGFLQVTNTSITIADNMRGTVFTRSAGGTATRAT